MDIQLNNRSIVDFYLNDLTTSHLMDEDSRGYFSGSLKEVTVTSDAEYLLEEFLEGRKDQNTLAGLFLCPPDARLYISRFLNEIQAKVDHPLFEAPAELTLTEEDNGKVISIDTIHLVENAPIHFGTRLFVRMVMAARSIGLKKIYAEGATHMYYYGDEARGKKGELMPDGYTIRMPANGYYTWPRLGFDNSLKALPKRIIRELPPKFHDRKRISDPMATEDGREWWKKNGCTINLTFNLSRNSSSMKILNNYIKSHNIRL